jgi:ribosomal protein S18 acetylase RimI-like enzyme
MTQSLCIKLIKKVDDDLIAQINSLLDEGTVWNKHCGEKFLNDCSSALFVAFFEGKAVGFAIANRLLRFDQRRSEVMLYEIGVKEEFRRRGIGIALVEEVKTWAKTQGADEVFVFTNKSNLPAVALYESTQGKPESKTLDEIMYVFKL